MNLQIIDNFLGGEINITRMIENDANDMVIREKYNNVLKEMKLRYRCTQSSRAYYEEGKGYWKYNVEYRFDHSNNVLLIKKTTASFDDDFNMVNLMKYSYLHYDPINHILLTLFSELIESVFNII